MFSSEGRLAAEHNVHDDSHGPHVALGGVAAFENLGGDVVRSAVRFVHNFVWHNALGQPKVYQFDVRGIVFFVQQEVLWLDVSVADPVLV